MLKDFIRYEKDNIFPEPITAEEALNVLQHFFLGEDWYVADPISPRQINVYIVNEILSKFPKQYKKFCKKNNWNNKGNRK